MKLNIALVNVINPSKKTAMNKDLNGGFGTCDEIGNSLSSKILKFVKKNTINLPIISFAYLQAIFKEQGNNVEYFEGSLPQKDFDLILIYGTIVDYKNENLTCKILKEKFPKAKIGFFGPFPSTMPELFANADFVLIGEPEYFFMNEFKNIKNINGFIKIKNLTDLNALPSPCFDGFPIKKYNYKPAISEKPFLVLQSSKGCPYSCRYYCAYGQNQGSKLRQRSAKKVVDDIIYLKENYKIKGIQFRDPTFGISKKFIEEFYKEMKEREVKISWGMETRLDLLNKENIKQMFEIGLRNINIGIETINPEIAIKNKRMLAKKEHQEEIIKFCKNIGVNVSAFYILGYEGDDEEAINSLINYSIKLNTPLARFSIATPYPGTEYFSKLEKENKILTKDFEKYNQFTLVFKHEKLSKEKLQQLLEKAYRKYYFRPSYAINLIKVFSKDI